MGSIAGSIAGSLVSAGASKLLGGGKSSSGGGGNFRPLGIRVPGLRVIYDEERGGFTASQQPERITLLDQIKQNLFDQAATVRGTIPRFTSAFGTAISGTQDLLNRVAPGASDLRAARLRELENARQRASSNLTQNLAKRRVAGSSFANQLAAEQELAFGQEAEKIAAESLLQELELTNMFQQQRTELELGQIDTELKNLLSALQFEGAAPQLEIDDQNFIAGLAAQLASGATGALQANSAIQMQLKAQELAGAGQFAGGLSASIEKAFENFKFSDLFGGGQEVINWNQGGSSVIG